MPPSRRTFLKVGGAAIAAVPLAIGADGFLWEPNRPRVVKVEIPLTRLPEAWEGFRIVQLSDFHYDPYCSVIPIRHSIRIVNELSPDLIVLTGDFVTAPTFGDQGRGEKAALDAEPCAALLAQLRSRLGSYAVMGNHDGGSDSDMVSESLHSRGINVLRNRAVPLTQNGGRLWLAGIDDILEGDPDLDLTLQGIPQDETVVFLAHEPDFALEAARRNVDLQLSGHSHGGQILLPFVGAPWLPPLGRRFPRGMYNIRNLTLYTNVGLGTVRIPVRWNCPPEITVIILRKGTAARAGSFLKALDSS